ncbi:hypothetical protein ROZALSC1DRAFT_18113 [Rozella allomycis CSF55]|nr:hypothetical protein ROZALSC1DRAFT_18113 [Rozella allomycis CSF55]
MSRVGSASFLSSNLVTSCISMSINDRCSTGRHVDRNKKCQKKFRNKVLSRDQRCVATGLSGNDLIAAHIMPLDRSELIPRNLLFSAKNGVLLTSQLEDDYDRHMWIFDETGDVRVLFQFWSYRTAVTRVSLSRNDDGPSLDLIRQHNELALAAVKHHCPNCWKYVGEINISNHQSGSCIALNNIDDGNDE